MAPTTSDADAERAKEMAGRIAQPLFLTKGDKTWKITASRIRSWITFSGAGAALAPQVDPAGVPDALKRIAKSVKRTPTEARYIKTRSGRIFGVSASSLGRALDQDATVGGVLAALDARARGTGKDAPVKVKTMQVAPALTTAEATKKAPLLSRVGSWTTYYTPSAHNGFAANITIPARKLDGMVINPGQAVRLLERPRRGELPDGLPARRSDRRRSLGRGQGARGRHLRRIDDALQRRRARWSRDPEPLAALVLHHPLSAGPGRDRLPSQTMRFRNDTKYPVLIKSFASPGTVRFEIWSVPNGRTITWSRPSISNVVRGYDTVQKTSTLPRGTSERIEWPVDGKDVSITRTVRGGDGRVIHRDVFVSHYHRMVGITLVGQG